MNKIILNPKCIRGNTDLAIDNKGRLIPCCYCDTPEMSNDSEFQKLLQVSNIDDYNSISDILKTKQWKRFYKRIKNNLGYSACNEICLQDKAELYKQTNTLHDTQSNRIIATDVS